MTEHGLVINRQEGFAQVLCNALGFGQNRTSRAGRAMHCEGYFLQSILVRFEIGLMLQLWIISGPVLT